MKPKIMTCLVATALLIAGCSQDPGDQQVRPDSYNPATVEATDNGELVEEYPDPLVTDPSLAAAAAMKALMSWQPAEQASPQDSAAAISERLTGELGQYAAAGEPDPVLPRLWDTWAVSGDMVNAVAETTDLEFNDEETAAQASVTVEQSVWHPDGRITPYSRFDADVWVIVEDGKWKAQRYEITDIDY